MVLLDSYVGLNDMVVVQKKKFGDLLIDGGLITATQLKQALDFGREEGIKLGNALKELGFVDDVAIARTLARQLNVPYVDLTKVVVDPIIARLIPEILARKHKILAIGRKNNQLLVAFADPLNIFAVDEVNRQIQDELVLAVGAEHLVLEAIDKAYAVASAQEKKSGGSGSSGDESEAVTAVNEIMIIAARKGASDVHIELDQIRVRVRLRVDGILETAKVFPADLHPNIVSRIKIMSGLDIGERRRPQDGRFELPVGGRSFDVRVSILPLNSSEKIVLRLLDKSSIKVELHELGFNASQYELFLKHLNHPHEIILVTGPTGSGKTTTLYGALNHINEVSRNIVTVEDPVEYELAGVNQVQVNVKANLTFSSALRSILRQDPDVVMIGEIRDAETAAIAIQAALTGHMVLSTLHTNDAAGAITRLVDMAIPPFLIASAVGMVVAQRLVRRLCPDCKESFVVAESLQQELGLEVDPERRFFRPVGCVQCDNKGYRGRAAIHEILAVSKAIEALVLERAATHVIARQAQKEGMITLRRAGLEKVESGLTSLEEVLRVSMDSEEDEL